VAWPDTHGVRSWTGRFVSYLKSRKALDTLDFFSFEWYPFDDVCGDPAAALARNPDMLTAILSKQVKAGLPKNIPRIITEYGYSPFAGQVEVELPGAMIDVESAAHFLALGGQVSYFYGLEPNWVFREDEGRKCDSYGNLMLFQFFDDWQIRPVAAFHAVRMLNTQWAQPGTGRHEVFAAGSDLRNAKKQQLVTAYAVRRPDGRMAILLLNKDPRCSLTVNLRLARNAAARPLAGDLDIVQYSAEQYAWRSDKSRHNGGSPTRNDPPVEWELDSSAGAVVTLPPYSITVVRTQERVDLR
jgi:hypothetical protein